MRFIILLICLMAQPLLAASFDPEQAEKMLNVAANAKSNAYLEARNTVVGLGTNALPFLAETAIDPKLTWKERLVSRICYERIARTDDIESLRSYNWREHPDYDRKWERSMLGPGAHMMPAAIPELQRRGLYYYYLEINWKDTGEKSTAKLNNINSFWAGLAGLALEDQSEQYYLNKVLIDRLENDPELSEWTDKENYRRLLHGKVADAVPVLIARHESLFKREVNGPEVFPGSHERTFRGMFEPILSFADSRHIDLLEKYINEHPALALLKDTLAEVRPRPAPQPKSEPPFRLGTNLVVNVPASKTEAHGKTGLTNQSHSASASTSSVSIAAPSVKPDPERNHAAGSDSKISVAAIAAGMTLVVIFGVWVIIARRKPGNEK